VVFGGSASMTRNPSRIYKYHVANLRELELAIGHTGRLARSEIASKDPQKSLQSLLRLYAFLIGAWAETRLNKLLHEEFGFNDQLRELIKAKSSQLEQWHEAVDQAFRKHHNVPNAQLNDRTLGVSHAARRTALQDVLSNDLKIIIEIRNKLAHGQWVYPFNNGGTLIEHGKFQLINQENILSLQFKFALVAHLADAVHDLVVSPTTFERDFDDHFRCLNQARINLEKRSYPKYEAGLIKSREMARIARVSNQ
jgi:hypothetical protein